MLATVLTVIGVGAVFAAGVWFGYALARIDLSGL